MKYSQRGKKVDKNIKFVLTAEQKWLNTKISVSIAVKNRVIY